MTKLIKKEYALQRLGSKEWPQFYVALPSAWVKSHGLGKGDKVSVYFNSDTDELVVVAPGGRAIRNVAFAWEN